MVIFLNAADSGRLGIGDEARVILDAVPDYVIPAEVSFVASDAQFTPKTVETEAEREKLMFRVQLRIDRQVLQRYYGRVETGLRGSGFVRTKPEAKWPAQLEVKLPPESASSPVAEARASAPAGQPPMPPPASSPVTQTPPPPPASPPVTQAPTSPTPAPASLLAAQTPARAPTAEAPTPAPAVEPATPTPIAQAPMPAPAPTPPTGAPAPAAVAEAPAPPAAAEAPAPPAAAEATTSAEQETPLEFAPESIAQLIGAWASSEDDCARLFQRRGKALAFRQPVDQFALAAIVELQRIRLPSAVCQVESASHQGGALKLDAECQDTVSYTSRTVHVKLRSDTEMFYSPTGDPVLSTTLMKCPL